MCFSPQADIVGGVVICAIGVDAVRHIGRRCEFVALAWIPLLLGAHQLIEALVWLWLQGHVPGGIGHVALWAYLLIAFVVLPVFIPLAVVAVEPTRRRKAMMVPFTLIGAAISAVLLAAMVRGPVEVTLDPYHLSYGIRLSDGLWIVALYVVAVCGPLLVSGYRDVVIFGIVNLTAVIIIAWLTVSGFASVWCGWAAVSSAAITLHCRFAKPPPQSRRRGLTGSVPQARRTESAHGLMRPRRAGHGHGRTGLRRPVTGSDATAVLEAIGDGPVHLGGPAEAFEDADHAGGYIDLAAVGAVPCASGIGMVHVVPALPERKQGKRPQVRGAVIAAGSERAGPEDVAQRIDAPGDVLEQGDPYQPRP